MTQCRNIFQEIAKRLKSSQTNAKSVLLWVRDGAYIAFRWVIWCETAWPLRSVSRWNPACSSKHAGVLHELYVRSRVGSGNGSSSFTKVIDTETRESSSEDEQPIVRKLTPNNNNTVLLRTSAVRIISPQHLEVHSCLRATWHCITGYINLWGWKMSLIWLLIKNEI